ncbi:MAG TPA: hypothetical protein VFL81_02845 [Candidatus Saccharimonadales bacterium]|nr:hypothetical protein [Candidatus Saccharimonadales bacterium]
MSLLSDIGGFFGDIKNEVEQISEPIKDLKQDLSDNYKDARQGIVEPVNQVSDTVKDLGGPSGPDS